MNDRRYLGSPGSEGGYGGWQGGEREFFGVPHGQGHELGGRYWSPDYGGSGTGFVGRGPKGYRRSDDRIREDVWERLVDSGIDAGDVDVEVHDGVVTLAGSVPQRRMRYAAEDVAAGCVGVDDVDNRLRVVTLAASRA